MDAFFQIRFSILVGFFLPNTRLVNQSFEASGKLTRYQKSNWHGFDTIFHLALDGIEPRIEVFS